MSLARIEILILVHILILLNLNAYNPVINENDIYFEKSDTGYELFIRKKDNISSILLTESQKTSDTNFTNYGLRTETYYDANSDEIRILDGKILHTKYEVFFLVDSTPQAHHILGDAFRFFLPEKVVYGYDWSRKGEIFIKNGVSLNIRMFEKPYSDYTGNFKDQWIKLNVKVTNEYYRPELIYYMNKIAIPTGGKIYTKDRKEKIDTVFKKIIPEYINITPEMDIIFIIDTTISMHEEFPAFVRNFNEIVKKIKVKIKKLRVGFIFYRDYGEKFITREFDMTDDINSAAEYLGKIKIEGGQDIPEALNEALYSIRKLNLNKNAKKIAFVITDAPAHSEPRGDITEEMATKTLYDCDIKLNAICLPFQ